MFGTIFDLSSANAFNLDHAKILFYGKKLYKAGNSLIVWQTCCSPPVGNMT